MVVRSWSLSAGEEAFEAEQSGGRGDVGSWEDMCHGDTATGVQRAGADPAETSGGWQQHTTAVPTVLQCAQEGGERGRTYRGLAQVHIGPKGRARKEVVRGHG